MSMRYVGGLVTTTVNPYAANVTTSPNYAQYNGVFTLAQQAQAATSGQWCTDPFFKNTTLLLRADGTANASQNNTFLDSSTNNFTITRNGNTTQGTFSPYGNLWSNYFDGSGDDLRADSNAAFAMGTGDFTFECWLNPTNWTSNYAPVFVVAVTGGLWIGKNGSNFVIRAYGVADQLTYATMPTIGAWTHVVAVRSGTTLSLYYNGTRVATTTNSYNFAQAAIAVGSDRDPSTPSYYTGYISNLRVVKGTALYTSNFTPSTTPLTAVSGTSLLTCQSNRFIDNSSNNFTLTVNGDTSVQRFSPFPAQTAYLPSVVGGSGYFDGNGDYVTAPASSAFQPGTGDFSTECWFYCTTTSIAGLIGHNYGGASSTYVIITLNRNNASNTAGYVQATLSDPSTVAQSTTSVFTNNTWNHVVCCRTGTTFSLFLNGIRIGTTTNSTNVTPNIQFEIGNTSALNRPFAGYVSNARFIKGSGPYDATQTTCTVPTSPLTAITNTSLLCNFTNAGIADITTQNDLETVGNAQVSTTVKKYGTGSLAFDGTGDYLSSYAGVVNALGTSSFTIEAWIYPAGTSVVRGVIGTGTAAGTWQLGVDNSNGQIKFWKSSNTLAITSSSNATINTWSHLAVVRSGTTLTLYLNGTSVGSTTDSSDYTITTLSVGDLGVGVGQTWQGYIDDLRITKGVARYVSNFTPPPVALPVQ